MGRLMPEMLIDTRGEFGIENLDALAEQYPGLAKRAVRSALKSEGYRLKDELQQNIRPGGPDSADWPPLSNYYEKMARGKRRRYKRRQIGRFSPDAMHPSAKVPMLKIRSGIRYKVDPDMDLVSIGFVDMRPKALRLLSMLQEGFTTPVTEKMRRWFFALGLPISPATKELKSPPRPLVGPVFSEQKDRIAKNLPKKFFANMQRYMSGAKA